MGEVGMEGPIGHPGKSGLKGEEGDLGPEGYQGTWYLIVLIFLIQKKINYKYYLIKYIVFKICK